MFIYLLPIAISALSYLLKIAVKLRLTLPLIYTIAMPTLFRSFYIAHTDLADSIFFLLIAISACSWLFSIGKNIYAGIAEQKAALDLIHQARARGEYEVHI